MTDQKLDQNHFANGTAADAPGTPDNRAGVAGGDRPDAFESAREAGTAASDAAAARGQAREPGFTHGRADIDMLRDVELNVTAELGRTKMTIGEITNLTGGSVVTLAKGAGEPADLRINDQLFASGEVIVMDGYFAVKITRLLSKEERAKSFS